MSITHEQFKARQVAFTAAQQISQANTLLEFASHSEQLAGDDSQTSSDMREASERVAQALMRLKAVIRRLDVAEKGKP